MSQDQIHKLPPQSLEAEMSILGCILIDNDAINRVLELLTLEDFYREAYRKIFCYAELKNMTALRARHTVAAKLYARGADEVQVGLLLGIAEPSAVRAQFPRERLTLEQLVANLI